ncbi:MAG: hypothetical protein QXR97_04910 [Thermoproteota archaeon]
MTEEPTIELLEPADLYEIRLCNPLGEQINKIIKEQITKMICAPNVEISVCKPLRICPPASCKPIISPPCKPLTSCIPDLLCPPVRCAPIITWPCLPMETPEIPWREIITRLDKLTAEVEELKKKVGR